MVQARSYENMQMVPANFSKIAKIARQGVVNIRTEKTIKGGGRVFRYFFGPKGDQQSPFGNDQFDNFFDRFFNDDEGSGRDYKQKSLGSGFIIDAEGYIVTNNHVIEDADDIKVKLSNGDEYDATVVGRDPKTDLALIKIPKSSDLKPLPWGKSDDMQVGDWVVAIGSPFGLEQTVTAGIVSAKGRTIGSGPYDDFIQTDASINQGNSGGPLLNLKGEVIGINTAIIAGGQGIGFAIPTTLARGIIDQLKDEGQVTRGWLGVGIQNLTKEMADYYNLDNQEGVLVSQVYEGDPADKAGIQPQDIIIGVNGKKITDTRQLSRIIADTVVGKEISIEVIRNGRKKLVSVVIARRDDSKLGDLTTSSSTSTNTLGMLVEDLNEHLASRFQLKENEKGAIVVTVEKDGKAAEAGIQPGDIIVEINRNRISSKKDYIDIVGGINEGDALKFFIKRRSGFHVIKMTK
ncbi:MAG: protease Do [Candidatus Magnetoglobus multicellularis str. Araruama]|uniref:Probable periplasmic serine endoprotease DegP-like n=1 Tax=Candidatus Magnetoglobus multicellularis str. Araruama TaxID=890399 RepID=A0A1V1PG40_9BACT|nr:MAG: protease Do [Candidatus Magnetoglobus multicellularis str. Araruama]